VSSSEHESGPPGTTSVDVVASSVMARMRPTLEKASRPFRDEARSVEALIAETLPFVESAARAARDGAPEKTPAWREARSFAWLLAYRLGDQGWPGPVVSSVAPAWRDAIGTDWARESADEVHALLLEGYARGREERARTEAQKGLAAALPVAEIAPGVVVIVAAGSLDPDGATALADRASSFLLRRDAKAALLDIGGMVNPSGAVLAELWAIPSSARMLGVRMIVSGVGGLVGETVAQAHLHDEGEMRVVTLADGVTKLLESANVAIGGPRGFGAWVKSILAKK
jgi:hypothetical protein